MAKIIQESVELASASFQQDRNRSSKTACDSELNSL
jgi:hypothetical protein